MKCKLLAIIAAIAILITITSAGYLAIKLYQKLDSIEKKETAILDTLKDLHFEEIEYVEN